MSTASDADGIRSRERRRRPEVARAEALDLGRRLLAEGGPRAVTLKTVGAGLGMSHANLIHHFGSAEQFHAQLAEFMLQELTRTIRQIVEQPRGGKVDLDQVVTLMFDAYAGGGIGALIAWSTLNGGNRAAAGLSHELDQLLTALQAVLQGDDRAGRAREMVRLLTSLAFADALLGRSMAQMLGEAPGSARVLAAEMLRMLRDG